jgi:hypothetical protein
MVIATFFDVVANLTAFGLQAELVTSFSNRAAMIPAVPNGTPVRVGDDSGPSAAPTWP